MCSAPSTRAIVHLSAPPRCISVLHAWDNNDGPVVGNQTLSQLRPESPISLGPSFLPLPDLPVNDLFPIYSSLSQFFCLPVIFPLLPVGSLTPSLGWHNRTGRENWSSYDEAASASAFQEKSTGHPSGFLNRETSIPVLWAWSEMKATLHLLKASHDPIHDELVNFVTCIFLSFKKTILCSSIKACT